MDLSAFRQQWAETEVERCLEALPDVLAESARSLPVVFAGVPPDEAGLDPDILGLFVGDPVREVGESNEPLVTRIELYLDNLWDFAERSPAVFVEEVRLTYLHELGHFFGWDEDDLERRGLG